MSRRTVRVRRAGRDHRRRRRLDGRNGEPRGSTRRPGAATPSLLRSRGGAQPWRAARRRRNALFRRRRRGGRRGCDRRGPSDSGGDRRRGGVRLLRRRSRARRASSRSSATCCITTSTSAASPRRSPSGPAAAPCGAPPSRRSVASTSAARRRSLEDVELGYRLRAAGYRIRARQGDAVHAPEALDARLDDPHGRQVPGRPVGPAAARERPAARGPEPQPGPALERDADRCRRVRLRARSPAQVVDADRGGCDRAGRRRRR